MASQASHRSHAQLHSSMTHSSHVKVDDCVICFDSIADDQLVKVLQPCNHYFHSDCINQWLIIEKRCPMCMRYLTMQDDGNYEE